MDKWLKLTNDFNINKNNSVRLDPDFIYKNTQIGFEFEFMTKLSDPQIVKSLEEAFQNKKVTIPIQITKLNQIAIANHSSFTPTKDEFKLERDFSGSLDMRELITGPIPFLEAKKVLKQFLDWLKINGYTTSKTSIHLNLSFMNPKILNLTNDIRNLNRIKFCLHFDENFVYSHFPNRKENVYARSIKKFFATKEFLNSDHLHIHNFTTSNTKYYGVNFLKQEKNYLEFRYLGGEGYEKKYNSILACWKHFIDALYFCLNNQDLTTAELDLFKKIVKPITDISESIINLDRFIFNFPKILLLVDLQNNLQTIKTFFNANLKPNILKLMLNGDLKEGIINYDSEFGKIQVKDAKLKNIKELEGFEFINCEIEGGLSEKNDFYDCTITNCIITHSNFRNCKVSGCKINTCMSDYHSEFTDCYIENSNLEYSGKFTKCIIRYDGPNKISPLTDCIFIAEKLKKLEKENVVKQMKVEDTFKIYVRK